MGPLFVFMILTETLRFCSASGILQGADVQFAVLHLFRAITLMSSRRPHITSCPSVVRRQAVKSSIVKRSIVIGGRKTSVSLEDEFWKAFKEIAEEQHLTLSDLAATIDAYRQHANLSSAIRLFVLGQYRDQLGFHREESSDHQGTLREQLVGVPR